MEEDKKFAGHSVLRNRKQKSSSVHDFFDEESIGERDIEEEEDEEEQEASIEIKQNIDWSMTDEEIEEKEDDMFVDALGEETLGKVMEIKSKGYNTRFINIIKINSGKIYWLFFLMIIIIFIVILLSKSITVKKKIIFIDNYENEESFLQRNSWKFQEDRLINELNIVNENDLKKQFWLWMAQWRIVGNARLDNRYTSEMFGPTLSIEDFDMEIIQYTKIHGFCSSAFIKVPLKYPIPKACGCQLSDNLTTIFYFPFISEKSEKEAQIIDNLHYISNKQLSSIIPVEITVLYTNKNMTIIKKRILRNEDVHCIIRCEEITDNRDYITEFLPKEY